MAVQISYRHLADFMWASTRFCAEFGEVVRKLDEHKRIRIMLAVDTLYPVCTQTNSFIYSSFIILQHWCACIWIRFQHCVVGDCYFPSFFCPNLRRNVNVARKLYTQFPHEHEWARVYTCEKLVIATNMLKQQNVRTSVCDCCRNCLHPDHVSEEKWGLNPMDRRLLQRRA